MIDKPENAMVGCKNGCGMFFRNAQLLYRLSEYYANAIVHWLIFAKRMRKVLRRTGFNGITKFGLQLRIKAEQRRYFALPSEEFPIVANPELI